MVWAIAAGFETVFADDAVTFYIGLVGGAMLLFMGATMLRNANDTSDTKAKADSPIAIGGGGTEESAEEHAVGDSHTDSHTNGGGGEEESFGDKAKGKPSGSMGAGAKAMDLPMGPTAAGVVTTLSNPYFFLWWATVGLLLVSEALEFGVLVLGAMMVCHWLCDLGWDWFVSGVTYRSQSVWTPSVHRGVFTVCGLILVVFGLWFGVGDALAGP